MSEPTIEQVREFMRDHDVHFICGSCGGSFFSTRGLLGDREEGYCKSDARCHFTWPRNQDGQHFYVSTSVNEVLSKNKSEGES